MQDPNSHKILSASIVREQNLTRTALEDELTLLISDVEFVYIKFLEKEFRNKINTFSNDDALVLVEINFPQNAPIVKELWEKVQKIQPEHNCIACVNAMRKDSEPSATLWLTHLV